MNIFEQLRSGRDVDMTQPDYVEAVEAETLKPVESSLAKGNVVLLAVYCNGTRLIDNAVM